MKWRLFPALLLALSTSLVACGGDGSPPGPDAAVYQSRGVVRRLPAEGAANPEIWLRHEAIPDFVDIEGNTVGMESMTMPFRLDPSVSLVGIETGEKVAFELAVDWDADLPVRITDLEELAPELSLDFESEAP